MNTTYKRRNEGRGGTKGKLSGWALWGAAALAVGVNGACNASCQLGSNKAAPGGPAGPAQAEALPTTCAGDDCTISSLSASLRAACPSGSCDPGPVNGNGIYVLAGGNYCLAADGPAPRFCPETFVNAPSGGVRLLLHDAVDPNTVYESPVRASLAPPSGPEMPVELVSVKADKGRLAVRLKEPGAPRARAVSDGELEALRLNFVVQTKEVIRANAYPYSLRMRPAGTAGGPDGPGRYEISYRRAGAAATPWVRHCASGGRPRLASFLGRKKIDAVTAEAVSDEGATTLSCETGAIETCLLWGYAPWNPKARTPGSGDYLFGSCLQAKRAAYFVGRGDVKSYTEGGTEIVLRDPFGIQTYQTAPPEAIWSPRGAECLNGDRLRRPELRGTLAIPPDLPRCDPLAWSRYGKLATGPGTGAP